MHNSIRTDQTMKLERPKKHLRRTIFASRDGEMAKSPSFLVFPLLTLASFKFEKMLLSEAQYKLTALLTKTKDLVPFATDGACDKLFATVAEFAREMLEENERRKEQNYDDMKLEELLGLSMPSRGSLSLFFLSFLTLVQEPKHNKRKQEDEEANNDEYLEDKKISKEAEAQPPKKRAAPAAGAGGAAVPWDIEKHPNVTEVTMVLSEPLQVGLLTRPAGQGKHTPIASLATEAKLMELDALPKAEKIEQQKRRRIIAKLTKALLAFAATNDLPLELKACLSKTEWGAELVTKLEFALDE